MNLADVGQLPATLTTEQAADLLNITVDHLYKLRREGEAPVDALELGRALRWPTVPLLELLGIDPTPEIDEPRLALVTEIGAPRG